MAEPLEIVDAVTRLLALGAVQLLKGKRVLVTSGPTHEPIDPVRYIANRSSGKQGHAIAAAAAAAGADVTLVSGPVNLPDPPRREDRACRKRARHACARSSAPCRPMSRSSPPRSPTGASRMRASRKSKRRKHAATPALALAENPDILVDRRASQARAAADW